MSVKLHFLLKQLGLGLLLVLGLYFDLLELRVVLQTVAESSTALSGPEFLMVSRLLEDDFLERSVIFELVGENGETIICDDANMELKNVFVDVNGFKNSHKAISFEIDVLKSQLVERVRRVVDEGLADVDAGLA